MREGESRGRLMVPMKVGKAHYCSYVAGAIYNHERQKRCFNGLDRKRWYKDRMMRYNAIRTLIHIERMRLHMISQLTGATDHDKTAR